MWFVCVAYELPQIKCRHLEDADPSRQRLAYALHELVGLRAGECDAPLLVRLVDHPLDRGEELRYALDLVYDERQVPGLEEEHCVLSGKQIVLGVLHGDVVEGVAQVLLEDGCFADLARPCHKDYLALFEHPIDCGFDFSFDVREHGLPSLEAILPRDDNVFKYRS